MTTSRLSHVPVALASATIDSEESRAFFQDRLRLYIGWVSALTIGFYLLTSTNGVVLGFGFLVEPVSLLHLAICVATGGVWLMTRRVAWFWPRLLIIDGVTLVLTCLLFAGMGAAFALGDNDYVVDPVAATMIGQLSCMCTVLTRAVALPSTPPSSPW
jgi:hypothetical protein